MLSKLLEKYMKTKLIYFMRKLHKIIHSGSILQDLQITISLFFIFEVEMACYTWLAK